MSEIRSLGRQPVVRRPGGRIVVDQFDPENVVPGGTDTCISDIIKFARHEDISVVGVTSNPDLELGTWIEISFQRKSLQFMPVARLDRRAKSPSRFRVPHSLRLVLGVWRYRRRILGETLQAHRIEVGFFLSLLRPNASLIQFLHNPVSGLTGGNTESTWRGLGWLYKTLERRVLRRARAVVVFSRNEGARLKLIRPSVNIAKTWFDPELFYPPATRPTVKKAFKVCFVGRLEEQKDPILAIDAFVALAEICPEALLFVAGSGPLEQVMTERAIQCGVDKRVRLLGAISRQDVATLMRDCHVMLMTSYYEGSPRAMAEAAATGLPVVATVGADTDLLLDGESTGVCVSTRSPNDIADALLAAKGFDPDACASAVADRAAPAAVSALLAL